MNTIVTTAFLTFATAALALARVPRSSPSEYDRPVYDQPKYEIPSPNELPPPPIYYPKLPSSSESTLLFHRILQRLLNNCGQRNGEDLAKRLQQQQNKKSIPSPLLQRIASDATPSRDAVSRALSSTAVTPLTGDIGVCSTIIGQPTAKYNGRLYSNKRQVTLYYAITPKAISCRNERPTTGSSGGKCVVAAYPHGAWIRVSRAEIGLFNQANCYPDPMGTTDSLCWDYIIVPGYCVLEKR